MVDISIEEVTLSSNQPIADLYSWKQANKWRGDDDALVLKDSANTAPKDKGEMIAFQPMAIRQFYVTYAPKLDPKASS